MKITRQQLRRIIKEELNRSLHEGTPTKDVGDADTPKAVVTNFKKAAKKAVEYAELSVPNWRMAGIKWKVAAEAAPGSGGGQLSDGLQEKDLAKFKVDLNGLGVYFVPELKNVV